MNINRFLKRAAVMLTAVTLVAVGLFSNISYGVDYMAEMEERRLLPVESNEIPNWPEGPAVGAESAILMEINTHTILYSKNIHKKMYPASTTKILTCLLAMQNCTLDENIIFSHNAIYDVPVDGSKLGGVDEGDSLNMENALYCVLVQSANEVASAIGEHIAEKLGKEKSAEAFARIMNDKAKELGCLETHFTNANGLFDEDHYTSAYDLALIGCEFFGNELLCKMASTSRYHFRLKETDEEDVWISSKNQLYEGKPYAYEYLLGSKTGFVSQSRQTLISAAEKDGMKLVCVVFTEETPYQFEDTISLFNYGFENFQRVSIDDNETKYKIKSIDLFDTDNDLFGDSTPLMSMQSGKYIILPNTVEFDETRTTLTYNNSDEDKDVIATINYSYSSIPVGSCDVIFTKNNHQAFSFAPEEQSAETSTESEISTADTSETSVDDDQRVIFVNIKRLIAGILIAAVVVILVIFIISTINSYNFSPRAQSSRRIRKRKHENRIAKRQARKTARWQKKQQRKRRKKRRRY